VGTLEQDHIFTIGGTKWYINADGKLLQQIRDEAQKGGDQPRYYFWMVRRRYMPFSLMVGRLLR
jgi:hypothetical protein